MSLGRTNRVEITAVVSIQQVTVLERAKRCVCVIGQVRMKKILAFRSQKARAIVYAPAAFK